MNRWSISSVLTNVRIICFIQNTVQRINDTEQVLPPVLQRRKARFREIKEAVQGHKLLRGQAGSKPRPFCLGSSGAFTLN